MKPASTALMLATLSFSLAACADAPSPFKDFPAMATPAKAGEHVLVPSYNWIEEAATKGSEKVGFVFYAQKMDTPGPTTLKVAYMREVKEVPNYMVVPITPAGKAKKGDILLTWWQSGSGMMRAYVVDAKDPAEPVVRYLDLDYDNPSKKNGVGIGQMEEKLKPNSFAKLTEPFAPGSIVACMGGKDYRRSQVINVSAGKLLAREDAGILGQYDKAKCQAIDLIPKVKAGDKVQVPGTGRFINGTVNNVDAKIGRVFVDTVFAGKPKTRVIAFGEVATQLIVK